MARCKRTLRTWRTCNQTNLFKSKTTKQMQPCRVVCSKLDQDLKCLRAMVESDYTETCRRVICFELVTVMTSRPLVCLRVFLF
jgi:hypothetical protein